jgi:diguanylate cyclase (GGDEF)-like protein
LNIPLHIKILLVFLAGAVLLLLSTWLTVASGRAYLESEARLSRLNQARLLMTEILSTVQDVETGERGYALTGKPAYLAPYERAVVLLPDKLAEARGLLTAAGEDKTALDAMAERARSLQDDAQRIVAARRADGLPAAQALMAGDAGKRAMDEIRAQIGAVDDSLAQKLRAESERQRQSIDAGVRNAWLLGALVSALFLAAYIVIVRDMRERSRLWNALKREATHDPLTQLPNRKFFADWLGYALAQARRDNAHIGLLYIDLDGFKTVNDDHGHKAGDAALAEIAARFRSAAREGDVLASLGGDEFALAAMHAKDGRELAALGERLLRTLDSPREPLRCPVRLTASIGIAFFPDDAEDVPSLVAAADAAMYAAKRGGKNQVAFYATAEVIAPA